MNLHCTWKDWGFGIEIGLPSRSKHYLFGTKVRRRFSADILLGPFTFEFGGRRHEEQCQWFDRCADKCGGGNEPPYPYDCLHLRENVMGSERLV